MYIPKWIIVVCIFLVIFIFYDWLNTIGELADYDLRIKILNHLLQHGCGYTI